MRKILVLSIVALCAVIYPGHAKAVDITTDQLIELCRLDNATARDKCMHYMNAFFDSLQADEAYFGKECRTDYFKAKDIPPIIDWLDQAENIKPEGRKTVDASFALMIYMLKASEARVPCREAYGWLPFSALVERCGNDIGQGSPCKFYTTAAIELAKWRRSMAKKTDDAPLWCEKDGQGNLKELTYMPDETLVDLMKTYLAINPGLRALPAAAVLMNAMDSNYSCQKNDSEEKGSSGVEYRHEYDGEVSGFFVTKGGEGNLHTYREDDALKFKLDYNGINGHTCEVGGIIKDGISQPFADSKQAAVDPKCFIAFNWYDGRLAMFDLKQGEESSCHDYCGARAWFADDYFPVNDICRPENIYKKIEEATALKSEEEMSFAKDNLIPVLEQCDKTLTRYARWDLRRLIALAQYHNNDKKSCRAMFNQDDIRLIKMADDEILEEYSYAPADAISIQDAVQQMRVVYGLCED
ncbi:MAG: hypothetical protein EYC62_01285 [Alphaproteobacteria bacterium]|nr:MAG: hypothetical protein EYC62_01285 [Alphaproteobacteria bacterium]